MSDSHPGGGGFLAPEPADPAPAADWQPGLTSGPPFAVSGSDDQPGWDVSTAGGPVPVVAAPRSRRGRKVLIAAGAAFAVLVVAGSAGAYLAYTRLAAHGDQPEQALPSSTIAMVKLDFDPAAGAKMDLYRLAHKFPALAGSVTRSDAGQSLKDKLVTGLLSQDGAGRIDYATDIKPWLGNRAALAAVPDAAAEHGVDPVLAIQVRDHAKMTTALTKIKAVVPGFGYAVRGEYALIADSQAAADHAAALDKTGTLAANPSFAHDLRSLPGHQLAFAWVDEAAVLHAVGGAAAAMLPADVTDRLTARLALGLHSSSSYAEISGATYGGPTGRGTRRAVDSTLADLPASTDIAVSVAGLGPALTSEWTSLAATAQLAPELAQIRAAAAQAGLNLPADIPTLLGTVDTVAVAADAHHPVDAPQYGILVTTGRTTRAVAFLSKTLAQLPVHVVKTSRGYAATSTAGFGKTLTATAGPKLAASARFTDAVPEAASATAVGYLNLHHLIQTDPAISAKDRLGLAHLSALGFDAHSTPHGATFTVRLTTQ